jgi:hypothetical protein
LTTPSKLNGFCHTLKYKAAAVTLGSLKNKRKEATKQNKQKRKCCRNTSKYCKCNKDQMNKKVKLINLHPNLKTKNVDVIVF